MEQELNVYNMKGTGKNIELTEEERKIDGLIIPPQLFEKEGYRVLIRKIRYQNKEIEELKSKILNMEKDLKKDLKK